MNAFWNREQIKGRKCLVPNPNCLPHSWLTLKFAHTNPKHLKSYMVDIEKIYEAPTKFSNLQSKSQIKCTKMNKSLA